MVGHSLTLEDGSNLQVVTENNLNYNLDFGISINPGDTPSGGGNYDNLRNKPSINGITLQGSMSLPELGLRAIYYDTKNNWNSQIQLIAEEGALYIYKDYKVIYDEVGNPTFIAGIKIGDGTSYLIDMPFISDASTTMLLEHIANSASHVSVSERTFWNNKVSSFLDTSDSETLVLSKTMYENNGEIIAG